MVSQKKKKQKAKDNRVVVSQLRTPAKIIRSMKAGITPEIIRPIHKVGLRKTGRRKRGKNRTLTDITQKKKTEKSKKGAVKQSRKVSVKKRLISVESSEEENEDICRFE
jgi:hypothetical protein